MQCDAFVHFSAALSSISKPVYVSSVHQERCSTYFRLSDELDPCHHHLELGSSLNIYHIFLAIEVFLFLLLCRSPVSLIFDDADALAATVITRLCRWLSEDVILSGIPRLEDPE